MTDLPHIDLAQLQAERNTLMVRWHLTNPHAPSLVQGTPDVCAARLAELYTTVAADKDDDPDLAPADGFRRRRVHLAPVGRYRWRAEL